MEYINIISKEEITAFPMWQGLVILGICVVGLLVPLIIYWIKVKDLDKVLRFIVRMSVCVILFEIISLCICSAFFREPTGRYKYEATIDKDKITVSEYEDFIEEYNPTIKDGIYYWEDKAE